MTTRSAVTTVGSALPAPEPAVPSICTSTEESVSWSWREPPSENPKRLPMTGCAPSRAQIDRLD